MAKCSECGKRIEVGSWPFCGPDGHPRADGRDAQGFIPPVVFRNPDGEVLFPGRSDEPTPAGYERVELRTVRDIRRFERQFNERERDRHQRTQVLEEIREAFYSRRNIDSLRRDLPRLEPHLRPYAELAIRRAEARSISVAARKFDPKVCFDAFSYDAHNRDRCDDPRDMPSRARR